MIQSLWEEETGSSKTDNNNTLHVVRIKD